MTYKLTGKKYKEIEEQTEEKSKKRRVRKNIKPKRKKKSVKPKSKKKQTKRKRYINIYILIYGVNHNNSILSNGNHNNLWSCKLL